MRDDQKDRATKLKTLAALLASDQLPVQQVVAAEAEVDQGMVSRALNGQLKRLTPRVTRLLEYATNRAGSEASAAAAVAALEAEPETARGGVEGGGAERGGAGGPAPDAGSFRQIALDGIAAYLEDGYDPRLIVEQLVVLRRAQQLRRSGRPRPKASFVKGVDGKDRV